jgi:hypothetical protein|tara:strand:- start:882 stop:1100 length:219 start_codon:yes stop_codon:yes gene_type:complete
VLFVISTGRKCIHKEERRKEDKDKEEKEQKRKHPYPSRAPEIGFVQRSARAAVDDAKRRHARNHVCVSLRVI